MEDVVVVVGKIGNFLRCLSYVRSLQDFQRTLGLRIAALLPANLLTGGIAKLLIIVGCQAICQIDWQYCWLILCLHLITVKGLESKYITSAAWKIGRNPRISCYSSCKCSGRSMRHSIT